LLDLRGPTSKAEGERGREGKGREGKRKGRGEGKGPLRVG